MNKFSRRIGDLECRSCGAQLLIDGKHTTADIVQWSDSKNPEAVHCWSVAYWVRSSEGFDLQFVGDRPFSTDKDAFWQLAQWGQEQLETENCLQGHEYHLVYEDDKIEVLKCANCGEDSVGYKNEIGI